MDRRYSAQPYEMPRHHPYHCWAISSRAGLRPGDASSWSSPFTVDEVDLPVVSVVGPSRQQTVRLPALRPSRNSSSARPLAPGQLRQGKGEMPSHGHATDCRRSGLRQTSCARDGDLCCRTTSAAPGDPSNPARALAEPLPWVILRRDVRAAGPAGGRALKTCLRVVQFDEEVRSADGHISMDWKA